jgi:hypothetical protein
VVAIGTELAWRKKKREMMRRKKNPKQAVATKDIEKNSLGASTGLMPNHLLKWQQE